MKKRTPKTESGCPCGSNRAYEECCGRFIEQGERPVTAESLMRSRYSAYALGRAQYLRATWHSSTCPSDLAPDASVRWIGLEILAAEGGGPDDSEGWVEFRARYKARGRAHRLHERSLFVREQGHWLYLSGEASWSERP